MNEFDHGLALDQETTRRMQSLMTPNQVRHHGNLHKNLEIFFAEKTYSLQDYSTSSGSYVEMLEVPLVVGTPENRRFVSPHRVGLHHHRLPNGEGTYEVAVPEISHDTPNPLPLLQPARYSITSDIAVRSVGDRAQLIQSDIMKQLAGFIADIKYVWELPAEKLRLARQPPLPSLQRSASAVVGYAVQLTPDSRYL